MNRILTVCAVLLPLMFSFGCGAVYTTKSISAAEEELNIARQTTPWEEPDTEYAYWSAVEYLREAKIQEGHSEYRAAQYYAERSRKFSLAAQRLEPYDEGLLNTEDGISNEPVEDDQPEKKRKSRKKRRKNKSRKVKRKTVPNTNDDW